jgi:hypothetical protein
MNRLILAKIFSLLGYIDFYHNLFYTTFVFTRISAKIIINRFENNHIFVDNKILKEFDHNRTKLFNHVLKYHKNYTLNWSIHHSKIARFIITNYTLSSYDLNFIFNESIISCKSRLLRFLLNTNNKFSLDHTTIKKALTQSTTIKSNKIIMIKELLNSGYTDIVNTQEHFVLYWAIQNKCTKFIKYLLKFPVLYPGPIIVSAQLGDLNTFKLISNKSTIGLQQAYDIAIKHRREDICNYINDRFNA